MKTNALPVIVTQTFDVTSEKLWEAITNVSQKRQWFFNNIPDFKPEVGFQTEFNVKAPSQDFLHL